MHIEGLIKSQVAWNRKGENLAVLESMKFLTVELGCHPMDTHSFMVGDTDFYKTYMTFYNYLQAHLGS